MFSPSLLKASLPATATDSRLPSATTPQVSPSEPLQQIGGVDCCFAQPTMGHKDWPVQLLGVSSGLFCDCPALADLGSHLLQSRTSCNAAEFWPFGPLSLFPQGITSIPLLNWSFVMIFSMCAIISPFHMSMNSFARIFAFPHMPYSCDLKKTPSHPKLCSNGSSYTFHCPPVLLLGTCFH